MGVYIPKMTIPEYGCASCLFCVEKEKYEYSTEWKCLFLDHDIDVSDCLPEDDCPLVEVKPHGRLIDADALYNKMMEKTHGIEHQLLVLNTISFDAPTIIEAEGEDGYS